MSEQLTPQILRETAIWMRSKRPFVRPSDADHLDQCADTWQADRKRLEAAERELAECRKREIPLRSGFGPEILVAQQEREDE